MELSRQEYPALLRLLSPSQAISILEDRVKLINRINSDIADWLAERRRVEETYVQGLRKLASRGPKEVSNELGIFRAPWTSIVGSMETLADSHGNLAQKIETDVERPLKEFSSRNREMQALSTIQGNLNSIAKDVEMARKKASKLSSGKASTNKVSNATSDVEAANHQWQSQAPYVFEQLQALDETRVNHLRDVLTQLETHEVDQVERNRTSAEACLNTILNINAAEELSAFVAKQSANAPTVPERQASRNRASSSVDASARPSDLGPGAAATPVRREITAASEASPFSTTSSRMGPPPSAKKGFGGLRRLGTVLTRDKGSKGMERPPSPEKRTRASRNPLRRGQSSKQDMHQLESPPQSSSSQIPSRAPQLADPLISTDTNDAEDHTMSQNRPLESSKETASDSHPSFRASSFPLANGIQNNHDATPGPELPTSSQTPKLAQQGRDAEGYNVAPNAVDDITRAQQEAAAAGDVDQSQLKLNIRDAPIPDDDDAAQQSAFTTVASTLRSQAGPTRKGTTRGRRDVRNTVFVPSGQPLENTGLAAFAGTGTSQQVAETPPMPSEASRGSDAQSVRSSHSVSSTTNAPIAHPQMHQPGLNASVVETVSATMQQGQVTKCVVIGEMALQHNPAEDAASPSSENVRLENFAVLEKVAPNPLFVVEKANASGEYVVNLSHTTRPAVAFKYQLHLDDGDLGAQAPITLTPHWKIEPTQASVIINYALNPTLSAAGERSITFKNVTISVTVEGTKAQSCQSKPAGIFSKEKGMMYWKLNEITLGTASTAPQRLLARFSTEGEGKEGAAEARWEISKEASGGIGSGLGISQASGGKDSSGSDPFADEDAAAASTHVWKGVPLGRRIVSGRYVAS